MDVKFLFGWAKENGIDLPKNSDGNINIPASFELYNEWKKKGSKGTSDEAESKQPESAHKEAENNVVELDENSELARLIASADKNKYDTIRRYLIENFGGKELELSDGKRAIIDNSDAKKLAHKADAKRTAELAELEKIIAEADFLLQRDVIHDKFQAFRYYATEIKYKRERSEIILNVGIQKIDKTLHLYAITNRPLLKQ